MRPGWNAQQAIAAVPPRSFRGTVWRVHWREIDPTDWALSLNTSGRYHRGLDLFVPNQAFPALYSSLAPEVAIWEMVRRSVARNPTYLNNNVLSELEVVLDRIVDLSDPTLVGVSIPDLTGPNHQVCQEIAAAAIARGDAALLVPSAALPGLNLVVLPQNLPAPPPIRTLHSTELPLDAMELAEEDEE